MTKLSKNYQIAATKIDSKKAYKINEAVKLVKDMSSVKFDATIELAIKLGIDSKQADQQLRGAHILPHGSGKSQKVLAIVDGDDIKTAIKAGADFAGADELIDKIKTENWFDYDVIVTVPKMMVKLGKLGKILGPKGLMPNPKVGTVTSDIVKAIKDIKNGKISYKNDKEGNIHVVIGKISFNDDKLVENYQSFIKMIMKSRPATIKGTFIQNISISGTMTPGVKIINE